MFEKQIAYFSNYKAILNTELREAFSIHGYEIKELITQEQLYAKGEDGDGKKLRGYKRVTIRLKKAKGQPADRTTLKDSGTFYASIDVHADDESLIISSNVPYDRYLLDPAESFLAYGYNVLKPNKEHLREFLFKYVIPNLRATLLK